MLNIARTFVSNKKLKKKNVCIFFVSLPIKAQPNESSVKSEKHEGKPFIKISDVKHKVLFVAFFLRSLQKEPTMTPLILTRQSSRASFLITAIFIDVFYLVDIKS